MARLLILCVLLCGCYVPKPSPVPPTPDPISGVDAKLLAVLVEYSRGCGESLVNTPRTGSERDYNDALRAARSEARLRAHRAEDELLSGDAEMNRRVGEAWLRVSKSLAK